MLCERMSDFSNLRSPFFRRAKKNFFCQFYRSSGFSQLIKAIDKRVFGVSVVIVVVVVAVSAGIVLNDAFP